MEFLFTLLLLLSFLLETKPKTPNKIKEKYVKIDKYTLKSELIEESLLPNKIAKTKKKKVPKAMPSKIREVRSLLENDKTKS